MEKTRLLLSSQNKIESALKSSRVKGKSDEEKMLNRGDSWENFSEGLLRMKNSEEEKISVKEKSQDDGEINDERMMLKHVFYLFLCVLIHTRMRPYQWISFILYVLRWRSCLKWAFYLTFLFTLTSPLFAVCWLINRCFKSTQLRFAGNIQSCSTWKTTNIHSIVEDELETAIFE